MHTKSLKILWSILATSLILLTACFLNASPKPPCDEKIDQPKIYEDIVLANALIQQLNSELNLRQVNASPCFVDNKVGIGLLYELPTSYSEYGITYSDYLNLAYSKDGTIDVSGGITQPSAFEKGAILDYFQHRIRALEDNPRIKEVITKTEPDPQNPVTPLWADVYVSRSNYNRVNYSFYDGSVRGYTLSNAVDWQEFPEIKLAHKAIEAELLVGTLARCSISRGSMHSYTDAAFHDTPTGPWYLTVALTCDDGWKDAFVQINNDGSHERLAVRYEYNNK